MNTHNPIPTKAQNPDGLHQRYIISKTDGSPVDKGAEYFVLRLDDGGGDPAHVMACRVAVLAYAQAIQAHLPKLARDLQSRYGEAIQTVISRPVPKGGATEPEIKPKLIVKEKAGKATVDEGRMDH